MLLLPVICWEPCKELSNGFHSTQLLGFSPKGDYSTISAVIPNTERSGPASSAKKTRGAKPAAENPSPPLAPTQFPRPQLSTLPPTPVKPLPGPSHPGNGCLPTLRGAAGPPFPSPPHRRPSALISSSSPGPSCIPKRGSSVFTHWRQSRHTPEEGEEPCASVHSPAG